MFTGIITELGRIESIQHNPQGARLCILCPGIIKETTLGDSIAVSGVCLTVTDIAGGKAFFDVSRQTLEITTTGQLKPQDMVNLELALRVGDRLGGHFVSGHVEDRGKILSRRPFGNSERIQIEAPSSVLKYTIPKGSIAIDGISLTVVDIQEQSLSVVIIPHTLRMTTLGFKKSGDVVNLEPDMLAKYVAHFVSKTRGSDNDGSLLQAMHKAGYL